MDDIYDNADEYNAKKNCKILKKYFKNLAKYYDMSVAMLSNKKNFSRS